MDYYINPQSLSGVFTVPNTVVDNYFKFSKPEHIKVLLFVLRNMYKDPEISEIAEECGFSEYEVKEALLYWADANVLLPKDIPAVSQKQKKTSVKQSSKPSRNDIAKKSEADPKIQFLLLETEKRMGRILKDNETRDLVWLYDDQGLDISVILLVIQYAISKEKANIRFIEDVCLKLIDKEIDNIADADTELHKMDLSEKCWQIVSAIFGIDKRKPSAKESEAVTKWIAEWKMSKEMISLAYDECVNKKSKFSFPYVAKVIEVWHQKGYMKPEDIEKAPKKNDFASYDMDLYEKMINSKD